MSNSCTSCLLLRGRVEEMDRILHHLRSASINTLVDIKVFLDEDDIDGLREYINELIDADQTA